MTKKQNELDAKKFADDIAYKKQKREDLKTPEVMTIQREIQLALENEWSDRIFQYYKTYIKPDAIRSDYDDAQEWYKLKMELKHKYTE
jgi:hypothetical protein